MLHRSSESLTVASLTSKARRVRGSLFHSQRPLSLHLLLQAGSPLVILPSRAREKKESPYSVLVPSPPVFTGPLQNDLKQQRESSDPES